MVRIIGFFVGLFFAHPFFTIEPISPTDTHHRRNPPPRDRVHALRARDHRQ